MTTYAEPIAVVSDVEDPPVRRSPLLSLTLTGVVVAVARWWVSGDRHIFHVSPDEPSELAMARWLAGATRWNMFDHATWQPGLATLITPFYWFTDNGETVAQWALGLNAVIGGLAAVVLAVLTRQLTGLSIWTSCALAVVAAVAPSSLSASAFMWAEPLVSLTFLATVLLLVRSYASGSAMVAAGAIACAVAGYTSHSRLLPMVGTTVLLTVGVDLWHRRWQRAAALATSATVMFLASALWTRWIRSNVWEDPTSQNTIGAVWKRARQPLDVADSLLGQTWYQMTATLGVATIGAWVLVRSCRRRADPVHIDLEVIDPVHGDPLHIASDRIDAVAARLIVATTAPLLLVSAIFMADRPRPDQLIYGRYNDAVMWPILALGMAWLVARVRHGFERRDVVLVTVTALLIAATGFVVDLEHGDVIRESYGVRSMIAGLLAFITDGSLDIRRASVIAALLFVTAVAVIAVSRRLNVAARAAVLSIGVLAFAGLLVVAANRTDTVLDVRLNGWARSSPVLEVDALVPPGVPLAVKTVNTVDDPVVSWTTQRQRYQVYQFYLADRTFLRDRGLDDDVGPYVFAPLGNEPLIEAGAELIWTDPSVKIGLWVEPTGD